MNFSHQLDLAHSKYAFYDLHLNNKMIADEIHNRLKPLAAQSVMIVGCIAIANELMKKGYNITILATSNDMKNYVKRLLPIANVIVSDMKNLNSNTKYDAIICLGDNFSYHLDDKDVYAALLGFHRNLKYGGIILLENLDANRLSENNYSIVNKVESGELKIKRTSSLVSESKQPSTAVWKVTYELMQNGKRNVYEELSKIRGFSESEIEKFLQLSNFQLIKFLESGKGNNFVTIARK